MVLDAEIIAEAGRLVRQIFDDVQIGPLSGYFAFEVSLDIELQLFLGLDDRAYRGPYADLLRMALAIDHIRDTWSDDAIQRRLQQLVRDLAAAKHQQKADLEFSELAASWLSALDIEFEEREYLLAIKGLSVSQPLTIHEITFIPLAEYRSRFGNRQLAQITFSDLFDHSDCIAISRIAAELGKASEIIRVRAEGALNILRYFGSLVWPREPQRHIYVAGRQPKRAVYTLSVGESGLLSSGGYNQYSPLPFVIDADFLRAAEFYDFSFVLSLLQEGRARPIGSALLLAIQWYGDALQDLTPIFAFVKFCVALETALKKKGESARSVVPQRLSVLIEPHIKAKQRASRAT